MYANLGPGMQLSPMPPSVGPTLMYSDQYVANRMRQTNLYAYSNNNPVNLVDPQGLAARNPGDVCGPRVWFWTGSWCVPQNVYDAALNAAGETLNCWWKCEIDTHKTICGKVLTTVEVISGSVSVLTSRIPKLPGEITDPFDIYKGLFRDLVRKFGWQRGNIIFRQLTRSAAAKAAKGALVVTAFIEAGISIKCGLRCGGQGPNGLAAGDGPENGDGIV